MPDISRSSKYGFLAVSEITNLGYCGGLLVLTVGGRPIEFHCTAPVAANRAQQILYGSTLKDFLICDQIGHSLLQKSKSNLDLVLVDNRELVGLKQQTSIPIVVVVKDDESIVEDNQSSTGTVREMDGQQFELFGNCQDNDETVEGLLKLFLESLPLTEPFERIRQAINEAHSEAA